ncbi:hypothetical protein DZJ_34190 [Dickeya ananatis]
MIYIKKDAPAAIKDTSYREFSGVKELPKDEAVRQEPYDTVTVTGYFGNQPEVNEAIGKAAQQKKSIFFLYCSPSRYQLQRCHSVSYRFYL